MELTVVLEGGNVQRKGKVGDGMYLASLCSCKIGKRVEEKAEKSVQLSQLMIMMHAYIVLLYC